MLRDMVKRRTYLHFRKSLPQVCQGALTNHGCHTLLDAIQALQEEDLLNDSRYEERRNSRLINTNRQFIPHNPSHPNNYRQSNNYPNNYHNNNTRPNNQPFPQNNVPRQQNPPIRNHIPFPNNRPQSNQNRYPNNGSQSGQSRRYPANNRAEPMDVDQNFHVQASPKKNPDRQTAFPTYGYAPDNWDTL